MKKNSSSGSQAFVPHKPGNTVYYLLVKLFATKYPHLFGWLHAVKH